MEGDSELCRLSKSLKKPALFFSRRTNGPEINIKAVVDRGREIMVTLPAAYASAPLSLLTATSNQVRPPYVVLWIVFDLSPLVCSEEFLDRSFLYVGNAYLCYATRRSSANYLITLRLSAVLDG